MSISQDQLQDIETVRRQRYETKRVSVEALEEILYEPIPVLDHGFIRVVDYMGDDGAVVQAARVSYGRGTRKVSEDRALIGYLMRHRHSTPFEMCEIKFHIKLPLFVARQWIRHRTANVNEYSARYSILDKEFYIPAPSQLAAQSSVNRQGRGDVLQGEEARTVLDLLRQDAIHSYDRYLYLLNEAEGERPHDPTRQGLARELARMSLSLNFYTQWYWKIDLHNLLHFLSLRADPHAQYEIRAYAEAMLQAVKRWVPLCYDAFTQYRLHAVSFSQNALMLIRRLLNGEEISQEDSGLGQREWREVMMALGRDPAR